MSALSDARDLLTATLAAAGVPVTDPTAQLTVPGALIRPGDPWLEPARVGGNIRTLRLSILLVAGAVDNLASLVALETLAAAAVPALEALAGWSAAPTSRARSTELAGATYLTGELVVETFVQL